MTTPAGAVTTTCRYCPMSLGDNMFAGLEWNSEHRWSNVLIVLGFWVFNRIMTFYFVGRFKVKR
ncbi:hypothetical protein BC829DRAFT_408307 [Chytridium lagenaria]|nr:hypothetical protein BC829DRAFT_408307 [Chytridium lagenaria]